MLSFEDLIKHLCHDCDVRELFSFASPVPPILFVPFIVAFRLRFTSTADSTDSLSLSPPLLFFPFAPFVSILFLRNYFGIRLDSISVALEPRPHTKRRLSPPSAGLFRNRDYDLG